eukprot:TRINITY_DN198_c0_g2_i1.p1 TRINITY_DN198_c0_g2~~TRINITY_DN198_c0_g2_i1.p1  ORF type:complete len:510 (+),score=49.95 TRINITY_DN198_c0_g2_i1:130-1659(+)
MASWLIVFLSLILCFALKLLFNLLVKPKYKKNLPPGPPTVPILGNLLWLNKSFFNIEPILRQLRAEYGPIVTLHVGSRPVIFVTTHALAHKALIQNGAAFADRPAALEAGRIINSNQHSISSAAYGPLWRLLRRNLISEILHPSRIKSYAPGRDWVLKLLIDKLKSQSETGESLCIVENFRYAMFCLLLLMCFGEKLEENVIRDIETAQRRLLLNFNRFQIFALLPKIGKILYRKRWNELLEIRRKQEEVTVPLIRARRADQKNRDFQFAYVDGLLDLNLPEEGGRKLNEEEIVTICSEFINAGTDTTSTSLQWIMANLVKHQEIQSKLFEEVDGVVKEGEEIKEEDLQQMPYLKAVILEALRRHPPGHFVLPHAVTEEVSLEEYVIPKGATINFMVSEMGWDGKVWKDPLDFKPERFLDGGDGVDVDITGSREIKMMPFGAGRRICPGLGLAMLHLEYFVANLVREFEWMVMDGEEVDLSEKIEFTVVMKNPLRARIRPRKKIAKLGV